MNSPPFSIAANVERVREQIARRAERAGRSPAEITLVAVSKTFSAAAIRQAYAAGLRDFGENRVQEWETKHPLLADLDATWHLVGHLQTNKARRAVKLFHSVDSVDSVSLAQKLDGARRELGGVGSPGDSPAPSDGRLRVLLEARLAPEESKSGADEKDLPGLAQAVAELGHLELQGLMCIPPYFDDPEQSRAFFCKLRELRDNLSHCLGRALPQLSMGMSHDFEVAIDEGATQVRLGTAIFGPRRAR